MHVSFHAAMRVLGLTTKLSVWAKYSKEKKIERKALTKNNEPMTSHCPLIYSFLKPFSDILTDLSVKINTREKKLTLEATYGGWTGGGGMRDGGVGGNCW